MPSSHELFLLREASQSFPIRKQRLGRLGIYCQAYFDPVQPPKVHLTFFPRQVDVSICSSDCLEPSLYWKMAAGLVAEVWSLATGWVLSCYLDSLSFYSFKDGYWKEV
jgi:hypothetical protein